MKKLVLALLIILPFSSQALTRISVQNGLWNNANNWSPVGVPQLTDDTIIVATDIYFSGFNIAFGNSLFRVAISGQLHGGQNDTITFGGDVMEINGYTYCGVIIVGANDSVVNNAQIEADEFIQSGTMINNIRMCIVSQLTTSDDFVNDGDVSSGNWINSGNVTGTGGQFCIAQNFINTDQISGSLDICDASPGGFGDMNMGTISGSVTNCAVGPCVVCTVPGYDEFTISTTVSISPNPVQDVATFTIQTELLQENSVSQFVISDVQGRVVYRSTFTGTQFRMERTGMESGLYFYSVILENGSVIAGKLMID